MCNCNGVTKGAIVHAVEGGCRSVGAVMDKTRAGKGCGSCKTLVSQIATWAAGDAVQVDPSANWYVPGIPLDKPALMSAIREQGLRSVSAVFAGLALQFWNKGAQRSPAGIWCSRCCPSMSVSPSGASGPVLVLFPGPTYHIDPAGKFLLTAVPTLVGAFLGLPYTFGVAKFGGRNFTIFSALLLLLPTGVHRHRARAGRLLHHVDHRGRRRGCRRRQLRLGR